MATYYPRSKAAFARFANYTARWAGHPLAFGLACSAILLWAVLGPLFHFSDTWQLVINTSTTIITFLMVFLLQHAQNKDSHALQLKLNEVVAALDGASNRLINVEDLTDEELQTLHKFYAKLALMAKLDERITQTHSVEEAEDKHEEKLNARSKK
jgi:low affinity Fe/Cu permease